MWCHLHVAPLEWVLPLLHIEVATHVTGGHRLCLQQPAHGRCTRRHYLYKRSTGKRPSSMPSLLVGYLPVGAMLAGYLLMGTMLTNTAFMGKRLLCSPCICIDSPYVIIIGGSSVAITPTHERFVGAGGAHEIATNAASSSHD
ncbi:hypothetical protein BHM03_00045141 [Ensete ventricosum]|nr:hypothetical protein BHM03_00045141 [Ensete ventricosum]